MQEYVLSSIKHPTETRIQIPEVYKKCCSASNCTVLAEEYRQMRLISEALTASNMILSPTTMLSSGTIPPWACHQATLQRPVSTPYPPVLRAKLIDLFCPSHLNVPSFAKDIVSSVSSAVPIPIPGSALQRSCCRVQEHA